MIFGISLPPIIITLAIAGLLAYFAMGYLATGRNIAARTFTVASVLVVVLGCLGYPAVRAWHAQALADQAVEVAASARLAREQQARGEAFAAKAMIDVLGGSTQYIEYLKATRAGDE